MRFYGSVLVALSTQEHVFCSGTVTAIHDNVKFIPTPKEGFIFK